MGTCATCQHIGKSYWGNHSDYGGATHFCGKTGERRRDQMKPTGDFSEDFMRNFRTFFDAKAAQPSCKYYEERELISEQKLNVLKSMASNEGKAAFGFFSEGNRLCEQMDGHFVERDEWASKQRKPSDGTRDWRLTKVGEAEVKRAIEQSQPTGARSTVSTGAPHPVGADR